MLRVLFSITAFFISSIGFSQHFTLGNLRCNEQESPLGVGERPEFSWEMFSEARGFIQSAYQILVSNDSLLLKNNQGNVWNSGIQKTSASIHVPYNGKTLQPGKRYYWRVQVFNKNGSTAVWSKTTSFLTGLFTQQDWSNASWIGYEEMPDSLITLPGVHSPEVKSKLGLSKLKQRTIVPLFRKIFPNNKKLANAIVFISGLGQYEMKINGRKVSNSFLSPGWTDYNKRVLYNTYDVTDLIKKGNNAISVMVGNGFYNINRERYFKLAIAYGYPKMICKLLLQYTDGSSDVIISDTSWKTAASPVTFSSIYGGEDYDARMEVSGDKYLTAFPYSRWKNAELVTTPKGFLEPEKDYVVKVNAILKVKQIIKPKDSIYVYDFGQNLSGIIELKVKGKKGQTVKLIPAELLNDNKLANQNATGKPYYFSYTLKGDGIETWQPRFTYYGFRYVQVEGGIPDTISSKEDFARIISIKALHTGNSAPTAGDFECSNKLFNQINELIKWAVKSNLQSVVTDCPHREKLSWLEQDYLMGGSIHYNYDIYHLYKKLVHDMMDAQTSEGLIPDIAPEFVLFGGGFRDSPEWGSASIMLPWLVYKWYGDIALLKEAYPMMMKYVAYLKTKSSAGILDYGLGDWYDYGPNHPGIAQLTPVSLTATAIYYYDLGLLNKMALLLAYKEDAAQLQIQAAAVKEAFTKKFFHAASNMYSTGSQTAMAMPLCVGLVDEKNKEAVFKNMVDSIEVSGKKLTAGDIGFHFLVQALQHGGASQLLYEMNYRDDVAGYGYQLKKGATALTESWNALKEVSNNHLMLGHIMEWFYIGLAGIDQADSSVAYQNIVIRPEFVGELTFVKGSYQCLYGKVVSEWEKKKEVLSLHVKIPANTTATVYLPADSSGNIQENGISILKLKDVAIRDNKNGHIVLKIGSGDYHFTVKR
jgi:hypothetical protein